MTAGHRDRGCQLTDDVDRCHQEDRGQIALQVSAQAVRLDFVLCDQHKCDCSPADLCRQICRRAPDTAHQADQVAEDSGSEQCADKRCVLFDRAPQVAADKVVQRFHDPLCDCLPLGNSGNFQIPSKDPAQKRHDDEDDPPHDHGHRDVDVTDRCVFQNRDIPRTVKIDIHVIRFHLLFRRTLAASDSAFRLFEVHKWPVLGKAEE